MYYPCSENKGADQLRSYYAADLPLCFRICKSRFSHNEAHLKQSLTLHYVNYMLCYAIVGDFHGCKNEKFQMKM